MLWSILIQILVLFDSFALCDIHDHFLLLECSPSLLSVTLYNLSSYFSTTFSFVLLPLLFPKWWFPPKFSVCTIMYYFFPLPVTSHRLIVLNITSQWMPPRYPFLGFSICCIFSHCTSKSNCHPMFFMVVAKFTVFYVKPLPLSSMFLLMALMISWFLTFET